MKTTAKKKSGTKRPKAKPARGKKGARGARLAATDTKKRKYVRVPRATTEPAPTAERKSVDPIMPPAQAVASEADTALDMSIARSIVERGDLSGLSNHEQVALYVRSSRQIGLDPGTQPLSYMEVNGKLGLCVTFRAAEQLARIHKLTREMVDGPRIIGTGAAGSIAFAVCKVTHPDGRSETASGAVILGDPTADHVSLGDPATSLLAAETKAKRRATLAILGVGLPGDGEARAMMARTLEGGTTLPPAKTGVAPQQLVSTPQIVEEFAGRLEMLDHPDDAASLWLSFRDRFTMAVTRQAAWSALAAKVSKLSGMPDAKCWLVQAVRETLASRALADEQSAAGKTS